MSEKYMQLFNKSGDPVFIGLQNGILNWTLPAYAKLSDVLYLTHLSDGKFYYEEISSQATMWSLPTDAKIISLRTTKTINDVQTMNRTETAEFIGMPFPEEASIMQMNLIASFLNEAAEEGAPETANNINNFLPGEKLIQSFDSQSHPVFVGLTSGATSWTLPASHTFRDLSLLAHFSEDNKLYYEDLTKNNTVTWSLPAVEHNISAKAMNMVRELQGSSTNEAEVIIGSVFNQQVSDAQMLALQAHFDNEDSMIAEARIAAAQAAAALSSTNSSPVRPTLARVTSTLEISEFTQPILTKTQEKWTLTHLHVGYLNKMARLSGRNWKKRFLVLTAYTVLYYTDEGELRQSNKPPKGELSLSSESKVAKDDTTFGFGFKVTTGTESLILAATSDIERKTWMGKVASAITMMKQRMMVDTIIELDRSKIRYPHGTDLRTADISKCEVTRTVIISESYLTFHANTESLSVIDRVFELNARTTLTRQPHAKLVYELRSGYESVLLLFSNPTKLLDAWKQHLGGRIVINDSVEEASQSSEYLDPKVVADTLTALQRGTMSVNRDGWVLNILQRGYLNKMARVSGRNWKKRYVILTPYCLAYYEDMKNLTTPKGQMALTRESVVAVDNSAEGASFGFKVTTNAESLVVTSSTAADRVIWMSMLTAVINNLQNVQCEVLSVIDQSKVKSANGLLDVTEFYRAETLRYFILTDKQLSVHNHSEDILTIKELIALTKSTHMVKLVHAAHVYEIADETGLAVWIRFQDSTPMQKRVFDMFKAHLASRITIIETVTAPWARRQSNAAGTATARKTNFDASTLLKPKHYSMDVVAEEQRREQEQESSDDDTSSSMRDSKVMKPRPFSVTSTVDDVEDDEDNIPVASVFKSVIVKDSSSHAQRARPTLQQVEAYTTTTNSSERASMSSKNSGDSRSASPMNALAMAAMRKQRKSSTSPSGSVSPATSAPRKSAVDNDDKSAKTNALSGYKSYMRSKLEKLGSYLSDEEEQEGSQSPASPPVISPPQPLQAKGNVARDSNKESKPAAQTSPSPFARARSDALQLAAKRKQEQAAIETEVKVAAKPSLPSTAPPPPPVLKQNEDSTSGKRSSGNNNALLMAARRKEMKRMSSIGGGMSPMTTTTTATDSALAVSRDKNQGENNVEECPPSMMIRRMSSRRVSEPSLPPPPPQTASNAVSAPLPAKPKTIVNPFYNTHDDESDSDEEKTEEVEHKASDDEALARALNAIKIAEHDDSSDDEDENDAAFFLRAQHAHDDTSDEEKQNTSPTKAKVTPSKHAFNDQEEMVVQRTPTKAPDSNNNDEYDMHWLEKGKSFNMSSNNNTYTSSSNIDDYQDDTTTSTSAAYVNALDLFKQGRNKPIVRIVFEQYSYRNQFLDSSALQKLFYDLGRYASHDEITRQLRQYCSEHKKKKSAMMTLDYEDFQVYWRDHVFFKTVRQADPIAKRRVFIASLFKQHDILAHGNVKASLFHHIHEGMVKEGYLHPKKHKLEVIMQQLDVNNKGRIEMNQFIDWMDKHLPDVYLKQSTLGRILGSFSVNSSATNSRSTTPTGIHATLSRTNSSATGSLSSGGNRSRERSFDSINSISDRPILRKENSQQSAAKNYYFDAEDLYDVTPSSSQKLAMVAERESKDSVSKQPNADFIPIPSEFAPQLSPMKVSRKKTSTTESVAGSVDDDRKSLASVSSVGKEPVAKVDPVVVAAPSSSAITVVSTNSSIAGASVNAAASAVNSSNNKARSSALPRRRSVIKSKAIETTTVFSSPSKAPVITNPDKVSESASAPIVEQAPSGNSNGTTARLADDGNGFSNPLARMRRPTTTANTTAVKPAVIAAVTTAVTMSTAPNPAVSAPPLVASAPPLQLPQKTISQTDNFSNPLLRSRQQQRQPSVASSSRGTSPDMVGLMSGAPEAKTAQAVVKSSSASRSLFKSIVASTQQKEEKGITAIPVAEPVVVTSIFYTKKSEVRPFTMEVSKMRSPRRLSRSGYESQQQQHHHHETGDEIVSQRTEDFIESHQRKMARLCAELNLPYRQPVDQQKAKQRRHGRASIIGDAHLVSDTEQLSLFHQLLQSRRLLYETAEGLANHCTASQRRILEAKIESEQRIAAFAEQTKKEIRQRQQRNRKMVEQETKRQAQAEENFADRIEEVQGEQINRRAMHAQRIEFLFKSALILKAQREDLHVNVQTVTKSSSLIRHINREVVWLKEQGTSRNAMEKPGFIPPPPPPQKVAFDKQKSLNEHYEEIEARSVERNEKLDRLIARFA